MEKYPWLSGVKQALEAAEGAAVRSSLGWWRSASPWRRPRGDTRREKEYCGWRTSVSCRTAAPESRETPCPGSPRPLVMYVGNLERYQGIDLLVESFQVVRDEQEAGNLVIIGGTPPTSSTTGPEPRSWGSATGSSSSGRALWRSSGLPGAGRDSRLPANPGIQHSDESVFVPRLGKTSGGHPAADSYAGAGRRDLPAGGAGAGSHGEGLVRLLRDAALRATLAGAAKRRPSGSSPGRPTAGSSEASTGRSRKSLPPPRTEGERHERRR